MCCRGGQGVGLGSRRDVFCGGLELLHHLITTLVRVYCAQVTDSVRKGAM
jgi:hypothetical protein